MLLSICIPTYNRAEYLQKTIESIVTQSAWNTGNTEIVISDNASTDSTSAVIAGYEKRYPGLIRSIRQDPAIDPHDNFEAAMRLGHGEYLKLNNDTLLWRSIARYSAGIVPYSEQPYGNCLHNIKNHSMSGYE